MTKHVTLAIATLAILSSSIGYAQVNATVGGTVTDPTGAVVPAVTVTATNVNTGIVTTRQTNGTGTYNFPSLQPGTYTVSAAFTGFRTTTFKGLELGQGQQARQNFTLQPADANQSVDVVAEADTVLSTTSASVGSVLSDKTVNDLPVLSRNVMDLVATSPGVVTLQGAFGPVVNFSGASAGATNTTRDGLVTNDGRYNNSNGAYSAIFTSPDMVEEVRISTNSIDPAAGRGIGQVQLRTRAGTNEFHGALFYSNQNSALSSNDWFANLRGADKAYSNRNQYGGRIGGPIKKNKAFFFFLVDNQRYLGKELVTSTTLTESARNGIFRYLTAGAPGGTARRNGNALSTTPSVDLNGNILTSAGGTPLYLNQFNLFSDVRDPNRTRVDPVWVGPQLLSRLPLPNDYSVGDGLNTAGYRWFRRLDGSDGATGQSPNPNRDHITVRGDYQLNDNNRLTFTMSYENNKGVTGQTGLPAYPDGFYGAVQRRPRFYTGAWTSVINSSLLNDFRIGYKVDTWQGSSPFDQGCCFGASDTTRSEASQAATKAFPNTPEGTLIYVNANAANVFPALGSYAPFGVSAPRLNKSPLHQFADTVTWNRGSHSLQFGFELNRFASEGNNTGGQDTTRPNVTLGIGNIPVPAIGASIAPGLNTNDQGSAQNLLATLAGSVSQVAQQYFVNSPSDTNWLDYRNSYVFTRRHQQNDFAFFAKDSWKVTQNLTLNLGLRYDKYGVVYDSNGLGARPAGGQAGAFGISGTSFANSMWTPGASGGSLTTVEFVGKNSPNPGKTIYGNDWNNLAPSIGFAYSVQGLGRPTVIRGGYGINYAGAADFLGYSGAIGSFPGLAYNVRYGPSTYTDLTTINSQVPVSTGGVQPFEAQSVYSPAGRAVTLSPYANNRVVPYIQSFNLSIQRELMRNMTLDVSWVGNKATKLYSSQQVNETNIFENGFLDAFNTTRAGGNAPLFDRLLMGQNVSGVGVVNGSTIRGSDALRRFNTTNTYIANNDIGNLANFFNTTTLDTGLAGGLIQAAGLPANFFVANPQFGSVLLQGNNSNSTYHAAQFVLTQRFARGATMQTSYVFSKNLGDVAVNGVLRDPRNRQLSKSILSNNRTHIFKINGTWELPFGNGHRLAGNSNAAVKQAVGGWTLAPVFQWVSGAPISFTTTRDPLGFRATSTADLVGTLNKGAVRVDPSGYVEYFSGLSSVADNRQNLVSPLNTRITNRMIVDAAGKPVFVNPQAGTTGNTAEYIAEGPGQLGFNLSLAKKISISERKSFTVRADAINVLNHPNWGNPSTTATGTSVDINSASFGRITATQGSVRTITLNARFDF